MPATFGVLTVESAGQAYARAGGRDGNKGAEAMRAALEAASAIEALANGNGARSPVLAKPDKAAQSGVVV